jgi:hypothetical protein
VWQILLCREALLRIPRTENIAVLGSTIEYRNLLAELGFTNIFVFERNLEFYNYITTFAKYRLKENVVEGDWIDTLKEFVGSFSVVLSDLTSGNIPYYLRDTFYGNISNSINNTGLFIDRILTKPIPFLDFNTLIEKYSILDVSNATANSFNCEVLFCSSLLENKEFIVDTSKFYNELIELGIPKINAFVNACYSVTPRDCIWWYSKDWKDERKLYEKYFNITAIHDEPRTSEYYGRAKLMFSMKSDYNEKT